MQNDSLAPSQKSKYITAMGGQLHRRHMKFGTKVGHVKTSIKFYYDPALNPTGRRPLWAEPAFFANLQFALYFFTPWIFNQCA